jgi:hypothetical protein|tara:strand:+ start:1155 stop:1349 length:195 start_codon:yes stop_codon:yes gene_type:complete
VNYLVIKTTKGSYQEEMGISRFYVAIGAAYSGYNRGGDNPVRPAIILSPQPQSRHPKDSSPSLE